MADGSSNAVADAALTNGTMNGSGAAGTSGSAMDIDDTPSNITTFPSRIEEYGHSIVTDPESDFLTCTCNEKPMKEDHFDPKTKTKPHCQALDCFEGRLLGCSNLVVASCMVRPSRRLPYALLCEVHLARLRRHQCCAGCGLFCSQGEYMECFEMRKQVHLFHKRCQIRPPSNPKKQHCPHCGRISEAQVVELKMNGPADSTIYLSADSTTSGVRSGRARMAAPSGRTLKKIKHSDETEFIQRLICPAEYKEPGITFQIPETKKTLSLAGLPLGPDRATLEHMLMAIKAEKESPIRFGNKNFYTVSRTGDVEKVLGLLAKGFDPNYKYEENNGETALHVAAAHGKLVVVHLLVQAGAQLDVLNDDTATPLMLAIKQKHNAIVRYLVAAGASIDIRGEDGMTPLHVAAKEGAVEAVHIIVSNVPRVDVNIQDDGGWTPLVWATEHRRFDVVKLLMAKGADLNIQDEEENIAIHWAAFSGDANICQLFLDAGTDINAVNAHGDTALHIAARQNSYEVVVMLLSRGANIAVLNKKNETAIQISSSMNQSESKTSKTFLALKINQEIRKYCSKFPREPSVSAPRVVTKDISRGKEFYQIQVVNGVNDEGVPADFRYVTENCETGPLSIDRTISSLQSCKCDDNCNSDADCVCATMSFKCWYDEQGRLLPSFNLDDQPMIFECNRACKCWKNCRNRVVQFGIRVRMEIFNTASKGWAVRALHNIPRGTFVCEYIGEIIPDSEADNRDDDSYLFDLDNRDGETFCLDARFYGNVSRFINHSCDPNLTPVKVFIDHQDIMFPRIALFASRDIRAGEELGFDYGEKFWVIKYKLFTCDCGAANCKYNKDTIRETVDQYYKRIREEHAIESGTTAQNQEQTATIAPSTSVAKRSAQSSSQRQTDANASAATTNVASSQRRPRQ